MELEWTKSDSEKLAQHYQSFISGLEAETLKAFTLKGLEQFATFSSVCREATDAAIGVSDALIEKFGNPILQEKLLSLIDGELRDGPADMIASFEKTIELQKRVDEMTVQRDEFIKQYMSLFDGVLYETIRAAKALNAKIEGDGVLIGLAESALLDAAGGLMPGLGTVDFIRRRVLNRAKHLHAQLQKSATVADSFMIFSEFMEQITEQMKTAAITVVEDAAILGNFVEFELPAKIAELDALNK
ncbi:hypothetical protein [Pacificibacter marinus]|uniref:Uncharacterized protein n=1 Tax=Pacificibacter marinus TaxID=658057 RepID=A0A1Y5TLZ7_9RHOB|nr:hypothetical protein [Pacificibacter marinus]SEL28047.1 hypothetical protein SAMN04488032_11619 [Pacificibacter marinus]SLN67169.1 hypothetical protein PAM7971_03551 [Pacificibacter marinus]